MAELLDHIQIHKDEMADTPAHHKQMEDFVGAEMPVLCVEDRQLEGVDDAAYGLDDTPARSHRNAPRDRVLHRVPNTPRHTHPIAI